MSLIERLTQDYKDAMRSRDEVKKSALNFILSQIKYKKIELQKELEDSDVIGIIKKEIKVIVETIWFMEKANKIEDIEIEKQKKSILESYLPATFSKEKTKEIINKLVEDLWIKDLKTWRGLLMKEIMANYKPGLPAGRWEIDGQLVNEIINEMLAEKLKLETWKQE